IWDLNKKSVNQKLFLNEGQRAFSLICNLKNNTVVLGMEDGWMLIYDIKSNKIISSVKEHKERINCFDIDNGFNALASGSDDKSILVWDLRKLENPRKRLSGHKGYVHDLSFSPKQPDILASSCSFDKTL